ncbi:MULTISPECIES: hypothetical protein [Acidiphilium]|uniref:Uncharacterized protein n=1 Tax=Acidiphilium rubrum TaxID=526 RepID=A0A8G2CJ78_ACIRU|nr:MULTISPECIES: hypothetical protein [Acidiphilium]SIQ46157.1 hypothetical protein SAMN05421828_10518 [Acidiphilium rubrum]
MSANISSPVDAIDGLALRDARDTLAEIKRGITVLRFALDALQFHVENMGAQIDPIPPSSLIGENRS